MQQYDLNNLDHAVSELDDVIEALPAEYREQVAKATGALLSAIVDTNHVIIEKFPDSCKVSVPTQQVTDPQILQLRELQYINWALMLCTGRTELTKHIVPTLKDKFIE